MRNELVPFLADIVGSEELLEKRLESLSQQNRKSCGRIRCSERAEMCESTRKAKRSILSPIVRSKQAHVGRTRSLALVVHALKCCKGDRKCLTILSRRRKADAYVELNCFLSSCI